MWNDVIDLRDFYRSALGQVARLMIRRRIQAFWPDTRGLRVLGLGFATPYLLPFVANAERVLAIMPSSQGVLPWPSNEPGLVALADETDLPLPDCSVDRVLIVHCLESTEHLRGTMREVWRVLADGGRLLVVVANRHSIWARFDRTPFGQGQPYSPSQLSRVLRDSMFMPLQSATALFLPPVRSHMVLRSAGMWEKVGERWFPGIAGVLLVEAAKQIYAAGAVRDQPKRKRRYVTLPQGLRPIGD
jgi:SAM-dependent methyltransferase